MTSDPSKNNSRLSEKDIISQAQKETLQNESFFSYLHRQWRQFNEYDLEPQPPPHVIENTAWNRIKAIFYVNRTFEGTEMSSELKEIITVVVSGTLIGAIFGGRYGAKVHTAAFIKDHKAMQYDHVRQAERHMHSHALLGFGKYALRWGWRIALFAGMYDACFNVISAARNKRDGVGILAAGTITGFAYKMFHGWREIVVGVVIGTGVSMPPALLLQGLNMLVPEKGKALERQKKTNERLKLYEEWNHRLGKTESTIGMISEDLLSVEIDEDDENVISEQNDDTPARENTESESVPEKSCESANDGGAE